MFTGVQTKPNLCHKQLNTCSCQSKNSLITLCSSHLSSALLLSPSPTPSPELLLPHHWAWDNPKGSDPTSPPLAPPHISSALSLPTPCQVLPIQILERKSAHQILVQPTDWLLLGQVAILGQSALSCWGQVTWWLPHTFWFGGVAGPQPDLPAAQPS